MVRLYPPRSIPTSSFFSNTFSFYVFVHHCTYLGTYLVPSIYDKNSKDFVNDDLNFRCKNSFLKSYKSTFVTTLFGVLNCMR